VCLSSVGWQSLLDSFPFFSSHLWANPILGQIDTFSASAAGWSTGARGNAGPAVISTGGPTGAGDSFLQLSSYVCANRVGGADNLHVAEKIAASGVRVSNQGSGRSRPSPFLVPETPWSLG